MTHVTRYFLVLITIASAAAQALDCVVSDAAGLNISGSFWTSPISRSSYMDRMYATAYPDVPPAGTPNGRTVSGSYFEGVVDVFRKQGFRLLAPDQIGFARS